ncbi:hypothetical protein HUU05_14110 [candidate division KSB1 bacterium]|nr:hypothetical protein [candidate division KSB1 bacterium]
MRVILKILLWPLFALRQLLHWAYDPMRMEHEHIAAARVDRRQFVPLLAQTISSVSYVDGRTLVISSQPAVAGANRVHLETGAQPFDLATDGEFIWYTDLASSERSVLRLTRDGSELQVLPIKAKSRALAFDGKHMWVTHPEANTVSRVTLSSRRKVKGIRTIALKKTVSNTSDQLHPTEIVCAAGRVWIAGRGGLARIEIKSNQQDFIALNFTPMLLAFDGHALWMAHAVEPQNNRWQIKKCDVQGRLISFKRELALSDQPHSITFDGTHLWVIHDDGATKIDVSESDVEGNASTNDRLVAAAFDGEALWVAAPEEGRLNRINIHALSVLSRIRPLERELQTPRNYGRMCFDGSFIWLTDSIETAGQSHGVIYRFLA